MLNTKRIKWMYENFGLASAIKSIGYDLIAILAYIGYCLTLPFRFVWMVCRGSRNSKK